MTEELTLKNTRIREWEDTKRKKGVFVIEHKVDRHPNKSFWVGLMIDGQPQVFETKDDARVKRWKIVTGKATQ